MCLAQQVQGEEGGGGGAPPAPLLEMAQTGMILEGLTQIVSSDWESMETLNTVSYCLK